MLQEEWFFPVHIGAAVVKFLCDDFKYIYYYDLKELVNAVVTRTTLQL